MFQLFMPSLEKNFSATTIILALCVLYVLINYGVQRLIRREMKKRKEVLVALKEEKEKYLLKHPIPLKDGELSGTAKIMEQIKHENAYATSIHLQEVLSEEELKEIHIKAKELKKEYRTKPSLIILSFSFSIFLFVQILFYLSGVDTIEHHVAMSAALAIITFLTRVTRKSIFIYLALSVALYFIYIQLNGAVNLFLLCYFSWNFLKKRIIKKKDEKATN